MLSSLETNHLTTKVAALVRDVCRTEMLPRFRNLQRHEVHSKASDSDPTDVVTVVDHRVEDLLSDVLRRLLPESGILGEEDCGLAQVDFDKVSAHQHVWIIDPLDGTRNFVEGLDTFGTMVALLQDEATVLTVIYLPTSDAMYTATRGGGAFLNRAPLKRQSPPTAIPPAGMLHTKFLPDAGYANTLQARAASLNLVPIVGSAALAYSRLAHARYGFSFYARLLP